MRVNTRLGPAPVALESTLPLHGVPRPQAAPLLARLAQTIRGEHATPAIAALVAGVPTLGLSDNELETLLAADDIPKLNTANLGLALHRKAHGATTVSTTMELAAAANVRVFATGGLGGVHRNYGNQLDISADLAALTRFPVAVVAAGVKSLLDVGATREALETLGSPVIGFQTDAFPAFYLSESGFGVDSRFDDTDDLAAYVHAELARTGRGVLVVQPPPVAHAIKPAQFESWLEEAESLSEGATGRDITPAVLSHLHHVSEGATLRTNVELAVANAALAGRLAHAVERDHPSP